MKESNSTVETQNLSTYDLRIVHPRNQQATTIIRQHFHSTIVSLSQNYSIVGNNYHCHAKCQ